jgi:hypothetical protein
MRGSVRAATVAAAASLAFVSGGGIAGAAVPTKNAIYVFSGKEKSKVGTRLFKVELHVKYTGTRASAEWYCGETKKTLYLNPAISLIHIASSGAFDGQYPEKPANDIWGLEGRFTSAKKAVVTFRTGSFNACTGATATYKMTLTS